MRNTLLTIALLLPALACSSEKEAAELATPAGAAEATLDDVTPVAVAAGLHEVRCGCSIDSIKKCGNYVDVDGQWLVIANPKDHGLGKMEWCGASGKVEATVAGTRSGNTIELATIEVAAK